MNLKVLDFTTRLPGPMAGAILAQLGATVHRPELEREDPFFQSEDEPLFSEWAKNFERQKDIVKVKLDDLGKLRNYDVILCPPSAPFKELSIKSPDLSLIMVIGGKGRQKYLHDLNALFLTKTFSLHLKNKKSPGLPYLPVAGIVFAQQIALETLAVHLEQTKGISKVYLDESVKKVLDLLWSDQMENSEDLQFLHNGKFPCYNIYQSKDGGHIALAAVESRFWTEFSDIFGISLDLADRFDASGKTGQKLSKMFLKYTTDELMQIIGDRDICLNIMKSVSKRKRK